MSQEDKEEVEETSTTTANVPAYQIPVGMFSRKPESMDTFTKRAILQKNASGKVDDEDEVAD